MITYGDYFKRRSEGETVKNIAESIGSNTKALNRSLERVGYVSEGTGNDQKWIWKGEGAEPLEREFLFGRGSGGNSSNVKRDSHTEVKPVKSDDSLVLHTVFTQLEIAALKEMIGNHTRAKEEAAPEIGGLYDRIRGIEPESKVRKTIVINESIGKALDRFADEKRVNKSDVIHLALLDFIKKHT